MKQKITILSLLIIAIIAIVNMQSCKISRLMSTGNNIEMQPKISDYHIFQGAAADLNPVTYFKEYELSTSLFTDYAEKKRFIKVPSGFMLTAINDALPDFPDGTILVKTFYYFKDKRDTSKGKQLIETRLLIKTNSKWSVGTYQWNNDQTEAFLITRGTNTPVNWIEKNGDNRIISYHIPGNKECASCHNSNNSIIPIGPKIRNLNIEVVRNSSKINQLTYFNQEGILNKINPSSFAELPDWENTSVPLKDRVRAYLDINCAHCHSESGYCSNSKLRLGYEIPFHNTQIPDKLNRIDKFMSTKKMPMLGTTIIDEAALSLIKSYIKASK